MSCKTLWHRETHFGDRWYREWSITIYIVRWMSTKLNFHFHSNDVMISDLIVKKKMINCYCYNAIGAEKSSIRFCQGYFRYITVQLYAVVYEFNFFFNSLKNCMDTISNYTFYYFTMNSNYVNLVIDWNQKLTFATHCKWNQCI